MHAIASSIAGSHRTSAAPTGSRSLRHLVLHRASSAAAAKRWDARISCGSASSAAGLRCGGPGISNLRLLRVVRSSDGLDSPWSVGTAAGYVVGPPGNGNSQVRQLRRGSTRGRPYAASLPPLSSSGHHRSPGRSAQPRDTRWTFQGTGHAQGRQLHRGVTRGGPNALGLASLKHYGSFG
jgi:hypothetical protein